MINKKFSFLTVLILVLICIPLAFAVSDDLNVNEEAKINRCYSIALDVVEDKNVYSAVCEEGYSLTEDGSIVVSELTSNYVVLNASIQYVDAVSPKLKVGDSWNIIKQSRESQEVILTIGEMSNSKVVITATQKLTDKPEEEEEKGFELSNGRNAEIKIMPSTASQKAIERLGLKSCTVEEGCTIELKEVGKGDSAAPVYEITAEKEGKFLGLFKTKAKMRIFINAETGEILRVKKPLLIKVETNE